jgi:hypothetical protein
MQTLKIDHHVTSGYDSMTISLYIFMDNEITFNTKFGRKKLEGKERRGGKGKPLFCLVGEKLREGRKMKGMIFHWARKFSLFPNFKEMRKKREFVHGAHM